MTIRALSATFGALYGYAKPEKKEKWDYIRFLGITAPLVSLSIMFDIEDNRLKEPLIRKPLSPFLSGIIGGPLVVGFLFCAGNEVGKMARKALNDS